MDCVVVFQCILLLLIAVAGKLSWSFGPCQRMSKNFKVEMPVVKKKKGGGGGGGGGLFVVFVVF